MFSQCVVTVAALRFLPSRMGQSSKERDVMGDLYRYKLAVRPSLNILQCSHSASATFWAVSEEEERLFRHSCV